MARLLSGTLVGRLPNAAAAIAIVLFVRAEHGSYATAGALAAAYAVANAVGQPLLGRLVDRYGQPPVQLPAAVLSGIAVAALVGAGIGSLPTAMVLTALGGLFAPPLEGGLRALWPSVLRGRDQLHTAYSLDAVAQEVMFAVGPLIVALTVSLWSAGTALVALHAVGVLGTLWVITSSPSRTWRSEARTPHWLGPLRAPGLLVVLGALLFVGVALGSITVAALAYAEDGRGGTTTYGVLTAALGVGGLVGGLAYGSRSWPGSADGRLPVLVACLALAYIPLLTTPGVVTMTALTVLAGLFLAPSLATSFLVIDHHAPQGTATEAFSWLVTMFTVGSALGSAVAGPVVEAHGALWGFAVPPASAALAWTTLLALKRLGPDREPSTASRQQVRAELG